MGRTPAAPVPRAGPAPSTSGPACQLSLVPPPSNAFPAVSQPCADRPALPHPGPALARRALPLCLILAPPPPSKRTLALVLQEALEQGKRVRVAGHFQRERGLLRLQTSITTASHNRPHTCPSVGPLAAPRAS